MAKNAAPEDAGNGTYRGRQTAESVKNFMYDELFAAIEARQWTDAEQLQRMITRGLPS